MSWLGLVYNLKNNRRVNSWSKKYVFLLLKSFYRVLKQLFVKIMKFDFIRFLFDQIFHI